MTAIAISGSRPITASMGASPLGVASSSELLPAPRGSVMGEEALFTLMSEISDAQTKFAKVKVEETHVAKKHAMAELEKALARQREAAKGGVLGELGLGDVAKVAAIAVSVAAVAVTGGASLAVAGALLSAGAFAVEKTNCFGDASKWVALGMSAAGGVASAASVAAHGAAAAQAASSAAQAGGASASAAAEAGAEAAKNATRTFDNVSLAVQAGTHAMLGAEKIEDAVYAYQADEAGRDAKNAQYQIAHIERVFDEVIEQLKDAKQTKQRGNERLSEIRQTADQTLLVAAGGKA